MTGTVFSLKRFAIHDGGGIRSTLFLKGCPLRCPWCQNPEGLSPAVRLWHRPSACVHCGACAAVCAKGAVTLNDRVHIDRALCDCCGECVRQCPAGAMEPDGWALTAEDAAAALLRDTPFFGQGGGVTLSGGEALAQPDFAREILALCRRAGADTVVETCLYAPWAVVEAFLPVVTHFIVDIKFFDSRTHKAVTGVPNELILENRLRLLAAGADVLVRTPLIPGFTAEEENLRAIAEHLVKTDPAAKYELLNFNPLCHSKYSALEQNYPVTGSAFTSEEMEGFYAVLARAGIPHIIKES